MAKNLENLSKKEFFALGGLPATVVFSYLESKGFEPFWEENEEGYDPEPRVKDDFGNDWLFGCDECGNFVMIEVLNYDDWD